MSAAMGMPPVLPADLKTTDNLVPGLSDALYSEQNPAFTIIGLACPGMLRDGDRVAGYLTRNEPLSNVVTRRQTAREIDRSSSYVWRFGYLARTGVQGARLSVPVNVPSHRGC
jgi:hypothetical protein